MARPSGDVRRAGPPRVGGVDTRVCCGRVERGVARAGRTQPIKPGVSRRTRSVGYDVRAWLHARSAPSRSCPALPGATGTSPYCCPVGSDAAIGVFDSGVGGLTVARSLLDQLPNEPIVYVGDTAHGPYGPLPIAEVRRHALAACDQLVNENVKLLVIACNSASSACLRDARERYDIPVVEVIQPATRRAVAATRNNR